VNNKYKCGLNWPLQENTNEKAKVNRRASGAD
jgi:hypothetical protein